MKLLKRTISYVLEQLGYKIKPIKHEIRRKRALSKVDLVLDVGANVGQYVSEIRKYGYEGNIVSFEPLGEAYMEIAKKSDKDPRWETINVAVGSENGKVEINVSSNSHSSSILNMLNTHEEAAPESTYETSEEVEILRLDGLVEEKYENEIIFLKIDTQGYEKFVIEGAQNIMKRVHFLEMEMSLVDLYEGEDTIENSINKMYERGYRLISLRQGFEDKEGNLLQVDGLFKRLDNDS